MGDFERPVGGEAGLPHVDVGEATDRGSPLSEAPSPESLPDVPGMAGEASKFEAAPPPMPGALPEAPAVPARSPEFSKVEGRIGKLTASIAGLDIASAEPGRVDLLEVRLGKIAAGMAALPEPERIALQGTFDAMVKSFSDKQVTHFQGELREMKADLKALRKVRTLGADYTGEQLKKMYAVNEKMMAVQAGIKGASLEGGSADKLAAMQADLAKYGEAHEKNLAHMKAQYERGTGVAGGAADMNPVGDWVDKLGADLDGLSEPDLWNLIDGAQAFARDNMDALASADETGVAFGGLLDRATALYQENFGETEAIDDKERQEALANFGSAAQTLIAVAGAKGVAIGDNIKKRIASLKTAEDATKLFRLLSLKTHPDKAGAAMGDAFAAFKGAYDAHQELN